MCEERLNHEEAVQLRDQEVQEFFAKPTGGESVSVRVFGEDIEEIRTPEEATYTASPVDPGSVDITNPEDVRRALCRLAGLPSDTPIEKAAKRCRLLWDINRWLVRLPMSVSHIVERVRQEVPSRKDAGDEELRREVEAALVIGAALLDGVPGALRLRAHRFIRGGWQFHRCVNPACGRLYPMGEERCDCGFATAPLYLCRNCGADYLRFVGDPEEGSLRPSAVAGDGPEWMLYEYRRFEAVIAGEEMEEGEDEEPLDTQPLRRRGRSLPKQMKKRPVLHGSFDPTMLMFSPNESDYALKVILAPARTVCLCCGGTAGSHNVITHLSLGTSAALKLMAEGVLETLDKNLFQ